MVKRRSVEENLDDLMSALMTMKDLMVKKGFFDQDSEDKPPKKKAKTGNVSESDTTIYRNAVEHQPIQEPVDEETDITFNLKRLWESTSSEEQIDMSDELIEPNCYHSNLITDQPGPSGHQPTNDKAKWLLQQVEASKARMYGTPGNQNNGIDEMVDQFLDNVRVQQVDTQYHSALVDENYLVIGTHLEKGLIEKIINNEYVDFA